MRKTDLGAVARAAVVLLALLLVRPLQADDAEARTSFGPQKAPALEALAAYLWPGSTLDWAPVLTVVANDGARRELRVGDVIQRDEADGTFTFVVALEFPEGETEVLKKIADYETVTTVSRSEIVAFKTTAAFAVTAVRRGFYNDTATVVQTRALELASEGGDLPWPRIYMRYRAVYGTADWFGEIDWQGNMTTDPVAVEQRLPGSMIRVKKDGEKRAEVPIILPKEDDSAFIIVSRRAKRILSTCAMPCRPDGKVLLGLW
jgi:hypothetical protein